MTTRILLVLPLLTFGCATPGGQALKSCELGALPQALQQLEVEAEAVLLNPSTVVADLETLAAQYGEAQFSCVLQALRAWLTTPATAPTKSKALAAQPQAKQHAADLVEQWFAAHPKTACGSAARL